MGKAKLRKKLEGLPKENIIRVVMTLYDASKEARRYLDFYAEPNSKDECEHFKHIIRQEFFPTVVSKKVCKVNIILIFALSNKQQQEYGTYTRTNFGNYFELHK